MNTDQEFLPAPVSRPTLNPVLFSQADDGNPHVQHFDEEPFFVDDHYEPEDPQHN